MNMTPVIGQNVTTSFQTRYIVYSDITVVLDIASHMETMGHTPMFTQKLSEIFCFFNLDQISDV